MNTVTVSANYRVTILKTVREQLGVRPDDLYHVLAYRGRVELIAAVDAKSLRGALHGMDTDVERDEQSRL